MVDKVEAVEAHPQVAAALQQARIELAPIDK